MLRRYRAWSGALAVMLITGFLVVLDLSNGPVHRYWSAHAFAGSVLSGLLVLLLTVLIVDRVNRMRQLRGQSRAIAAQLYRALEDGTAAAASVDQALDQLRAAAAPLSSVLDREQRAAVSSDAADSPASASETDSGRQT